VCLAGVLVWTGAALFRPKAIEDTSLAQLTI